MTIKDQLLLELAGKPGEYLSGEEIAARLSVTRSAVWKAVKALRGAGCAIDAAPNRGYRLSEQGDMLCAPVLLRYLTGPGQSLRVEVRDEVTSTNALCRERAAAGEPEGLVVVAQTQSAGRGRMGRTFYSPSDVGLYISVLLRPALPADAATGITCAAAVAVAEAIEEVSGRSAGIKWVNDILMDGKKVCGILTEGAMDMEGGFLEYAVVGIGVNVREPMGGYPEDLRAIAGAVFPAGTRAPADARNHLAGEILSRFMALYARLSEGSYVEAYRARSIAVGKTVKLKQTGEMALILAVDDRCRLIARMKDGEIRALSSGEISILL